MDSMKDLEMREAVLPAISCPEFSRDPRIPGAGDTVYLREGFNNVMTPSWYTSLGGDLLLELKSIDKRSTSRTMDTWALPRIF